MKLSSSQEDEFRELILQGNLILLVSNHWEDRVRFIPKVMERLKEDHAITICNCSLLREPETIDLKTLVKVCAWEMGLKHAFKVTWSNKRWRMLLEGLCTVRNQPVVLVVHDAHNCSRELHKEAKELVKRLNQVLNLSFSIVLSGPPMLKRQIRNRREVLNID